MVLIKVATLVVVNNSTSDELWLHHIYVLWPSGETQVVRKKKGGEFALKINVGG